MTQRLEPASPPYAPDVEEDLTKLIPPGVPPLGLFRAVAHNPRVLRRMRRGGLLDRGSIGVREREIMILRTTALCGAEYEWSVHVAFFGEAAGFSEAELVATVHGDALDPAWSARERLLIALADTLHASADVPDELFEELRRELTPAQIVELVTLAGQYHQVSFVVNSLRIEHEPGARRFPPPPAARG